MALTREEVESRFRDYVDQGEEFCERAKRHYETMFGDSRLGPGILIREYAKGLRELDKLCVQTADFLAEVRSSEAFRKEEHQQEMKKIRIMEEELAAAKAKAGTMEALSQEFSQLSTIVSDSAKAVDHELSKISSNVSTISTKVEDVSTISSAVSAISSAVSTISTKVEDVPTISSNVSTISNKVEDVPTILSTVSAISSNVSTIPSISSTVSTISFDVSTISSTAGGVQNTVSSISSKVTDVESNVLTISSSASTIPTISSNVSDLSSKVETIQKDVRMLKADDGIISTLTADKESLQSKLNDLTNQLSAKSSQLLRPNDYISKKRKLDAGAVEVTIFDDWQALLLKQHEMVSLLSPMGEVKDLSMARFLIMQTFRSDSECFKQIIRYQTAPQSIKTGWRCLGTINVSGPGSAREVKDDRPCPNCQRMGKACVQVKDEGCIWFRVVKD